MAVEEVGVRAVVTGFDTAIRNVQQLERAVEGIGPAARGAGAPLDRMGTSAQKAGRSFKEIESGGSALEAVSVAAGAAAAAVGVAFVGAATAAVAAGIQMNASLETATLQFQVLMGDATKAEEHVRGLFEFAKRTPFETGPIIEASRILETFGGAALNTTETLTLVGDAAAGASAGINEVAMWVGRAYAAIQSGRPFGEAAQRLQELGLLTPQARAELEALTAAGADSQEVWAVLTGELERFQGSMELQAATLQGLTSTLQDTFGLTAAAVIEPFFELFKDGLATIIAFTEGETFTDWTNQARAGVQRASDAIRDLAARIADSGVSVDQVTGVLAEFSDTLALGAGGLAGLGSIALRSVPIIGGLVPAINPVGAALGVLALSSDDSRTALADLAQTIGTELVSAGRTVGPALAQLVDAIAELAAVIIADAARAIANLAQGFALLRPVLSAVSALVNGLTSVIETFVTPIVDTRAAVIGLTTALAILVGARALGAVVGAVAAARAALTSLSVAALTAGTGMTLSLGPIAAVAAGAAVGVGLLGGAFESLFRSSKRVVTVTDDQARIMRALDPAAQDASESIEGFQVAEGKAEEGAEAVNRVLERVREQFNLIEQAAENTGREFADMEQPLQVVAQGILELADEAQGLETFRDFKLDEASWDGSRQTLADTQQAVQELQMAFRDGEISADEFAAKLTDLGVTFSRTNSEGTQEAVAGMEELVKMAADAGLSITDLEQALDDQGLSASEAAEVTANFRQAVSDAGLAVDDATGQIVDMGDAAGDTRQAIEDLGKALSEQLGVASQEQLDLEAGIAMRELAIAKIEAEAGGRENLTEAQQAAIDAIQLEIDALETEAGVLDASREATETKILANSNLAPKELEVYAASLKVAEGAGLSASKLIDEATAAGQLRDDALIPLADAMLNEMGPAALDIIQKTQLWGQASDATRQKIELMAKTKELLAEYPNDPFWQEMVNNWYLVQLAAIDAGQAVQDFPGSVEIDTNPAQASLDLIRRRALDAAGGIEHIPNRATVDTSQAQGALGALAGKGSEAERAVKAIPGFVTVDTSSAQRSFFALVEAAKEAKRAVESVPKFAGFGGSAKGGGAQAGIWRVPGSGRGDSFPALLEPGEMVVPRGLAEQVRRTVVTAHVPVNFAVSQQLMTRAPMPLSAGAQSVASSASPNINVNVSGATLDDMQRLALNAVNQAFRDARSNALRQGGSLMRGISVT